VDGSNLAKAIATYERTFVSPDTRFDRWIAGDEHALTQKEVAGFRLFTGKAGCVKCHGGSAFTDYAFHDIGLPGEDRGRGAVLRLAAADHAFKTPGLRQIARSAPYTHDGSLATLEDVLRHYVSGVADRPTLSKDLTRGLKLSDAERADLIAFLGTLTSEGEPAVPDKIVAVKIGPSGPAEQVSTVSQDDKAFHPTPLAPPRGGRFMIPKKPPPPPNPPYFRPRPVLRSRPPGAGGEGQNYLPRRRLVSRVLRHPSEDGALRRRRTLGDQSVAGLPPCVGRGGGTI